MTVDSADTLRGIKATRMGCSPVRIAEFCYAIAGVYALELTGYETVMATLIDWVTEADYIPETLCTASEGALPAQ